MYACSPYRIAENGAYVPDSARLVPTVMVLPFTPVVSLPGGHEDVSINDAPDPAVAPDPMVPEVGGFAVERLPPHAAPTRATAPTSGTASARWAVRPGVTRRRSIMRCPLVPSDGG